jgi:hypothetical protein
MQLRRKNYFPTHRIFNSAINPVILRYEFLSDMKSIFFIVLFLGFGMADIFAQTAAPASNAFTDKDVTLSILNSANPYRELTLYDPQGEPAGYIDCKDDYTIYFWDGTPVAYLALNDNLYSIYSFNGNHLGWFVNGIIIDHEGSMVGTSKDILSSIIYQMEPFKEFKKMKPVKKMRAQEPFTPLITSFWSNISLGMFLAPVTK